MIVDPSQRVLLVDIDSVIPNLALMKVSSFFKMGGASVGFYVDDPTDAYISVILKKNRPKASMCANMIIKAMGIGQEIGQDALEQTKDIEDPQERLGKATEIAVDGSLKVLDALLD